MTHYTALLIEDSALQARMISEMIARCGWSVLTSFDLRTGFETIANQSVDLIISDLNLPDSMDGATIARLKEKAPQATIAAISAGGGAGCASDLLARARADGAEFLLKKPFNIERLRELLEEVQSRRQNGTHRQHVLVVDDSKTMRAICLKALKDQGYRATAVESMDEVFEHVDILDLDAILTDVNMPGRSPIEAVSELREALPGVAIVAMSGDNDGISGDRSLRNMLDAGCDVAISKPFTPDELSSAIRKGCILAAAALLEQVRAAA
jgi:CheY-like chemotaxis protein